MGWVTRRQQALRMLRQRNDDLQARCDALEAALQGCNEQRRKALRAHRARQVMEQVADALGVDPTDPEQDVCWDDLPGLVTSLDRRRTRAEAEVRRLRERRTWHSTRRVEAEHGRGEAERRVRELERHVRVLEQHLERVQGEG